MLGCVCWGVGEVVHGQQGTGCKALGLLTIQCLRSILAGAVMAALWRAAGAEYTTGSLIHAVLHLEQMLTTGGGWQDQV